MPPRRRQAVPTQLTQGPQLTPLRSPVDLYYRPNVGRVEQAFIYDLAPASRTLAAVLRQKREKDKEKLEVEANRFVQENQELVLQIEQRAAGIKDPKERRKVYQETFDNLQKNGLPAAADPFFQQLYARAAARMMLGRYHEALTARQSEAAGTRGEDGSPALPPDIDSIIGQEWAKFSDSPAIQNFYGGQVAFPLKERVDEQFRVGIAKDRAARIESETRDMVVQDLGQQFDLLLHANQTITTETLRPITDYVTNELRGHNVQNPREWVLSALELSFQRAAAVDVDEAVRAVYAAQELEIGGVRLGDDRSGVGLRLEQLKRRYIEQGEAHLARQNGLVEQRRKAAILDAENEYVGVLLAAKRDGANLTQVSRGLSEKFAKEAAETGRFDGQIAFVQEDLERYTRAMDVARQSDQTVLDQFNVLMADGKVDDAEALVRAALDQGAITGEDYASARAGIEQRRSVSPYLENNGLYNTVRARYREAAPSGFADEIQDTLDAQRVGMERRLERDFAEFVRSTAGEPDRESKHRAWLEERQDADLKVLDEQKREIRGRRDELVRDVRRRFQRHTDSEELIAQGEREGTLTVLEAQALREENEKAATREEFYRMREYAEAEADIDRHLEVEIVGAGRTDVDALQLQIAAHDRLRDELDLALDGVFADETVDPRHFTSRARMEIRRIKGEILDELFPSARREIQKAVRDGQPAQETLDDIAERRADLENAMSWRTTLRDPRGRESITAADPRFTVHPAVNADLYDAAARWMSGVDPFFGPPTTREDVERVTRQAVVELLRDETLDDADRQDAIGAALSTVGVPADAVLAGSVTLVPPPSELEYIRKALEVKRVALKVGLSLGSSRDRIRREIASLEERADPAGLQVPLEGVTLNPYTTPFFRSEAELEAFVADDARLRPLLERLGLDPDDERAAEDWGLAQLTLTRLTNP